MTKSAQSEITQSLVYTNTQAAQAWMGSISRMAQQGNEQAQAIFEMTQAEEGLRAVWEFVATINAALASCAFELPFDDLQSAKSLANLVDQYPQLQWAVDQHRENFPLNDLNEDLEGMALENANARLEAWLGQ